MTEIQETIALENLQCKPIKGIDLPLPATGQILQIEEIQGKQYHPPLPKGSLLQMLLPSELKIPSLEFLEEEDMTHMEVVVQPKKTPGQNIRETKLKREIDVNLEAEKILAKKAEDDLMKVTGEEREKTIKCMLKVLKHQVKSVEDQAAELIDHAKVQEKELEEFKMELKRKENEIFRQELQQELDMTKKIAGTYKFNSVDGEQIVERLDIAEIIVDNEVLMARVDQLLKPDQGKGYLDSGQLDPTTYTLSSTLIDDLYNQASAQLEKKKQKNQKQSHKQVTAAVIKQSHPLEKNKIRPSSSKSPKKQLKSALKNSPSKSKTQASPQKQKKQNFISNTIDMNPPMTKAEFEKIKQKRISDIHNRYQIVSFGSEKHQGEQQTSFNHQNISKSEQMLKEKRQKQLENLDKILNEEIATALKCQVQLMKDVKN